MTEERDRVLDQIRACYRIDRTKRKDDAAPLCFRCKTNRAIYVPLVHGRADGDPGGLGTPESVCYRCALAAIAKVDARPPTWTRQSTDMDVPEHGTMGRYTYWGCRCSECRRIAAETRRRYRQRAG